MKAIKTTTISIPKSLAEKIKKRLKKTGFKTASEYVVNAVKQSLAEAEKEEGKVFSPKEEKKAKERLKSLGYLD